MKWCDLVEICENFLKSAYSVIDVLGQACSGVPYIEYPIDGVVGVGVVLY